jgi:recombinational DNA repair protein (RecF pathway)
MPTLKDEFLVLRTYEQGNTSLVLVLLGRRLGQVRVMAKGARRWTKKGFENPFDLLARGEAVLYPRPHGDLWIFKEWDERERLGALGSSARTLAAASFLCELAEALTREMAGSTVEESEAEVIAEEREHVFTVLNEAAHDLAADKNRGETLLTFTLRALEAEGLLPDLEHCSGCGLPFAKLDTRAKVRLGPDGLRCTECLGEVFGGMGTGDRVPRGALWLSAETRAALRFFLRTGKGVRLTRGAGQEAAKALIALVHGGLEHDLRLLRYAAWEVAQLGVGGAGGAARKPARA